MNYDSWKLETPPSSEEVIETKECNECFGAFNSDEMEFIFQPKRKLPSGVFIAGGHVWVCKDCKPNLKP